EAASKSCHAKTIAPSAGDNNSNDDFRLLVTEILLEQVCNL
ncbi:hypothetical protein A2U01_0106337, partial [Trifolium medium]|nr:hypothetical protein [Trifolium medium]